MDVHLRVKFEVFNIILIGFSQGEVLYSPPPQPQNEPLKILPRLALKRLNNSVTYDRGVRLKCSSLLISHFSILIGVMNKQKKEIIDLSN